MNAVLVEFIAAAKQGPRLFFAPWIGAVRAVVFEIRRLTEASATPENRANSRRDIG
jgi:hypothetical protein